jgi:hypothetical protein
MMRKIVATYLIVCGLLFGAFQCFAQLTMVGVENGRSGGGGGGFTGAIDINGAAYVFWSTRCSATAYTGNVVDIWDTATGSTTETLVTCSSGGVLNTGSPTALATTCSVSCNAKIVYDQSGASDCAGPCDITTATNADRPLVTTSCQNAKICLAFNGSAMCLANASLTTAQLQPYTTSVVFNRTGNVTTLAAILGQSGGVNLQLGGNSSANQVYAYGGGAVQTATANDSTNHAMQTLMNGASSSFYIDGSLTSMAGSPGTNGLAPTPTSVGIGSQNTCGGGFWTGNWFETGIWGGDKTANNSTMNGNQHTYWSF